jgi:hypothetical protein
MRYETTLRRAALALLAGAAAGATIVTALHLDLMVRLFRTLTDTVQFVGFISSIYLVLFVSGLLVLGVPAWWPLHRLGRRNRMHAIILGATLTLVSYVAFSQFSWHVLMKPFFGPWPVVWLWTGGRWPGYGPTIVEGAIWYAFVGSLVGLLIWRIAYRPSRSEELGR